MNARTQHTGSENCTVIAWLCCAVCVCIDINDDDDDAIDGGHDEKSES